MAHWLLLFVSVWACQAAALTQISLSADAIQNEVIHLEKPRAVLDINKTQAMTIHADRMQIVGAEVQKPQIALVLGPHPVLLISTDMMQTEQYLARQPRIRLEYSAPRNILASSSPILAFDAEVKSIHDSHWGKFHLNCLVPDSVTQQAWRCTDGMYQDERTTIPFKLEVTPSLQANENRRYPGIDILLNVEEAKFADESGLHAGEHLSGTLQLSAHQERTGWRWHGEMDWTQGELFWQPFYFAGGHKHFAIQGLYQAPYLDIEQASLQMQGVGNVHAQSRIDLAKQTITFLKLKAAEVDFNGVYGTFIQPLIAHSALGKLKVSGKSDWSMEVQAQQVSRFDLNIVDASVEDTQGKFGFAHLNAHIPWDYDHPQTIQMEYAFGHLLNIPLGATQWQAEVNRYALTAPQLALPVLDGALLFKQVSAAWINQSMVWSLKMDMQPISMQRFSQALNWPAMRGQIDGEIPLVTYANHQLRMDGDMLFTLFNGKISLSDLQMDDPLGAVPRLHANLSMRDIDLGEITRTFNFGSMMGKLEGDVKHLRMQRWKPVYMDAVIQTADGPFEKKVSQRAVENITALGGEGTAAALQRTVLRFFDAFGYEKIGLRCELRGDVCKMGGVENTVNGFAIVKGKGIPTVNVNGYTQYVSWKDILSRMQRITDRNAKMIVK